MGVWGRDQEVCATCRYWGGAREIDWFAAVYDAEGETGKCMGPLGSFRGAEMHEGASCSEWAAFRDDGE